MTILLFYGGLSSEHEISIRSEANIKEVLISLGYSIKEIFITKDGRYLYEGDEVIIIPQKGFFTKENKIEFARKKINEDLPFTKTALSYCSVI